MVTSPSSPVHPSNADWPIDKRPVVATIKSPLKPEHPLKAKMPIVAIDLGKRKEVNPEHPAKAFALICVTVSGIIKEPLRDEH